MMKKRFAVLLLTAIVLFTCSCGKAPGTASPGDKEPTETQSPPPSVQPKTVPISEAFSTEGSFKDEWGYDCSYSYHVPQLDADTPDAAYINDVIATTYGEIVTASEESIEQKIMPDYASIGWESYQNGSMVSVVIKTITYYSYREDYRVFNYDAERGAQLFTSDILAMKNVSEDTYYHALRRTVMQYFDHINFDVFTDWADQYRSNYAEKRGQTCSDKTIADQEMTYLDANGALASIVPVGCFTESDYVYQVFSVDLEEEPAAAIEDSYFGLFSAVLENEELTVFLLGESEAASKSYRGEPYAVHGLYADYTQVRCGVMGEISHPYVFLLTDAGRVEFVNMDIGIHYGYFCGSGPILGVEDIVSLKTYTLDNGFETVVAVNGSGEKIDLAPFVQAHEQSISDRFLTNWSTLITYATDGGGSYEDYCYIEVSGWDQIRLEMINFDADTESDYTGRFTFLGTSDDGCVYAYSFADQEGIVIYEGVASMFCDFSDGINGFANYLYWKDLGCAGIFTMTAGEEMMFTETFG